MIKNKYLTTDTALLKKIGSNIKHQRSLQGISQERLANLCEMDRGYMGRVERGEMNISILKLKKISNTLKIKITDLINGENK